MAKRKKPYDDPFNYLDNFFIQDPNFSSMFNSLLKELYNNLDKLSKDTPMIYGVNVKISKDGVPMVEPFGNVKSLPNGTKITEEREPLVDVINKDGEITVIAELPGVSKEDIKISASRTSISIYAKNSETGRDYAKVVKLPAAVEPDSATAKYNNGVLEINIKKGSIEGKIHNIKVD